MLVAATFWDWELSSNTTWYWLFCWGLIFIRHGCFYRDHLESYTNDYTIQVLMGYCMVYIFMQTFMIPGTVFMSLLAGSLFGVFKGVALVVFTATAGASSCYFLSKLIGRPLVFCLWPDKLNFFQSQVNYNSSLYTHISCVSQEIWNESLYSIR